MSSAFFPPNPMIDDLVFHMTAAIQLTQKLLEESQLFQWLFIDLSFKGHITEFFSAHVLH